MTITYTAEVATCLKFGSFIKLLARWRGSIYKLIWMDLVLFLTLYYLIHVLYYYLISGNYKETFESIVVYCSSYLSVIPLSFVLGFYVNLVMSRWWEQYITIPWPDSVAVFVSACIHGQDEGGRLMRRTIMRYVCLCLTIVFTMISPGVKKRFPKMKYLVDAGLLLENEREIFEKLDIAFPKYPKHWMPIIWAASIVTRARKEGRIRDDFAVKTIVDELNDFRGRCGILLYYDFISIPLVYTQVVTIAVYSFFLCSLLAHQWTEKKSNTYEVMDFYNPIFITLQFFFYMGWLKVAEALINPFGEDDDDFEVNWMIDRNLQVSYLIVDEMHHEHPELFRDQYWDEVYPSELPYISEAKKEQHPKSSTAKYDEIDSPKGIETRPLSKTNLLIMNGKLGSAITSSRSQRLTEAFQRFLNYSQASLGSDVENSYQSALDIEDVNQRPSYIYSDQIQFESQIENESIDEPPILETIKEESETFLETLAEEDMINTEETEGKIETQSSYETDSDFDPFERLRIERFEQRLKKMNDYLERYFGTNFRILTELKNSPETNFKSKTPENISSNQNIPDTGNNPANKEFVKNEFGVKTNQSLIEFENGETLKQATVDKSPIPKETKLEDNDYSEKEERSVMKERQNTEIEENMKENLSGVTLAASITEQENILLETDPTSLAAKLLGVNSVENLVVEIPLTVPSSIKKMAYTFKDRSRSFESKAISPLDSSVGSSVQSFFGDLDTPMSDINIGDEQRIEQEKDSTKECCTE